MAWAYEEHVTTTKEREGLVEQRPGPAGWLLVALPCNWVQGSIISPCAKGGVTPPPYNPLTTTTTLPCRQQPTDSLTTSPKQYVAQKLPHLSCAVHPDRLLLAVQLSAIPSQQQHTSSVPSLCLVQL